MSSTGIKENSVQKLKIYPNPTNGQLIIEYGELTIENIEIYNIVGQMVGVYPCGRPNNAETITIDVSHLSSGMYYLKIADRTVKFLKE